MRIRIVKMNGKNSVAASKDDEIPREHVILRRELGLPSAIGIAVGSVIGSGIFVMPGGAARGGGSVGMTLILWTLCGLYNIMGALTMAELATMIPRSGGVYYYLKAAYGRWFGYMFCWLIVVLSTPSGLAISALTCAKYGLALFYQDGCGDPPEIITKIVAVLVLTVITAINCYSVKLSARIHVVASTGKVLALIMIILGGVYMLATGHTQVLSTGFQNTNSNLGTLALGMYSCQFAFGGWDTLTSVCEEVKNQSRNVPRACIITTVLILALYLLTNISYFTVLSVPQLLESPAVGVAWARVVMPRAAWIIPLCVGLSTFGSLNAAVMGNSRVHLVLARENLWPNFLSMINVNRYTPVPSVIMTLALAVLYLALGGISSLVNFTTFLWMLFMAFTQLTVIILRYKMKDVHRPYRVFTACPLIVSLFSMALFLVPLVFTPQMEFLYSISLVVVGLVPFLLFLYVKQPAFIGYLVCRLQLFLQVCPQTPEAQIHTEETKL